MSESADPPKKGDRIVGWVRDDMREYGRMESRHLLVKALFRGNLHKAPLTPKRVLDCFSCTGLWATEMSELYPEADITGIDPCRLTYIGTNSKQLSFIQGALEPRLPFDDMTFDLVHSRANRSLVRAWDTYLSELHRVTTQGGWVNIIELSDIHLDEDTSLHASLEKWSDVTTRVAASLGLDNGIHLKIPKMLQDAGYTEIKEESHKIYGHPCSSRSESSLVDGSISRLLRKDLLSGITRFGKDVLDLLFGSECDQENQSFLKRLRKELQDPTVPWYLEVRSVIGKKPNGAQIATASAGLPI